MISVFGPRAERIRDALPPELDAVVFDESGVGHAARDAAERRARGERFSGMALFDGERVKMNATFAAELNRGVTDPERRYYSVMMYGRGQSLGGETLPDFFAGEYDAIQAAAQSVLAHADELLVRSFAEYAALCVRSEFYRSRPFRRIALAHTVPAFDHEPAKAPSVVVWTGRRDTADATFALIALEEFRGEVAYVGDEPIAGVAARFIARNDPSLPEALGVAGCVVCIDPADPADAVAFARRGMPVVAPVTCGAYEFAEGVLPWDMADGAQLSIRTNFALGRIVSGTPTDIVAQRPAAPAAPPARDRLPLVTILTATHNRRDFLRRMLTCVAAQTYPNVESLIVNDAGEPVEDIVAEFPFARLINAEVNQGTFFRAARLGLPHVRGDFVAMLPDDDWFYPDHIELMMAAILRTGAAIAHSFALLRFLEHDAQGHERTYGFNTLPYAATVNPTSSLVGTPVAMSQCLQRRDTYDAADVGWPLLGVAAEAGSDQEYFMRILKRHQLVAVDRYTCEFRDHAGNSGKTYNWADAMDYIYREEQPLSGRPITESLRETTLGLLRKIPVGENTNKPNIVYKL
jgi:Glycosyl transferase family 2